VFQLPAFARCSYGTEVTWRPSGRAEWLTGPNSQLTEAVEVVAGSKTPMSWARRYVLREIKLERNQEIVPALSSSATMSVNAISSRKTVMVDGVVRSADITAYAQEGTSR